MRKELKKLNKKIKSANNAVDMEQSRQLPDIDDAQVSLLNVQILAMTTYSTILEIRIENDTRIEKERND